MSTFPRPDYGAFEIYTVDRRPVAVDLSDNTNLWGVHPASLRAVRAATPETFVRYPTLYADRLRDQVATMFDVDRSHVTTGCGSDDVLDSAIRAAGQPPGVLTYAAPTFVMAALGARMNGLEPRAVPWARALESPTSLLEGDPIAVYLCTPNNPSGAPLSESWLDAFFELRGPTGPFVILDEAYADFHGWTAAPLVLRHGRALVVRTLSKLYALAGARVGYGVGAPDVIEQLEKSRGPYKVSAVSEMAAVAALADEDGWAADVLRQVRENRARMVEALADRGLEALPSVTNFLLVPVAPHTTAEVVGALRERGVAVRGFPDQPGLGDAIRITIGPWPMMSTFLEALDEVRS